MIRNEAGNHNLIIIIRLRSNQSFQNNTYYFFERLITQVTDIKIFRQK